MPTTELFVVDSAGVVKKVSKLSARFYQYKKQIAAGKIDPSRVSVNLSHPAVTAAHQHGKAAMARETPPTCTSPRQLEKKAASTTATTARSAGLARSGASSLARTALARSNRIMGSESATLGILNIPTATKLPLNEASEDKDEDEDDDDVSAIIIGNLFPPNDPGVAEAGGGGVGDGMGRMGRRKAMGTAMILIFPTPMMPTACLTLKLISFHSSSVCVIIWTVTKLTTRTESVLSGPFFSRWVLLCAIWTR